MKFLIGSQSKRKIKTVKKVIRLFFDNQNVIIKGYSAKSQVPDTPYDIQTYQGAYNRALDCKKNVPDFDYYIGLESGLVERYGHIYEEAWAVVITSKDEEYFGYSSGLKVPDYILKRMDDEKMDHSNIMTIIEHELGNLPNDTWGTYSGGKIIREVSLEEALRNSFIQILDIKKSLYKI